MIQINDLGKEQLFEYALEQEQEVIEEDGEIDIEQFCENFFCAEIVEDYCIGNTNVPDDKYQPLCRKLIQEYLVWRINKRQNTMPYENNSEHIKKTMPSDHTYDFTKSSERYRWKCDKTREILENLRDELWKSSHRHTVMIDDKCALSVDTLDMHDFYCAAYRLFGISLE